jgi:hypothetical protein
LTSTATPAIEIGKGTLLALCVVVEKFDPKIAAIPPGENACWYDAAFATAAIEGAADEPDPEEATLTVTDALGLFDVPVYCAVIVPVPSGNCDPVTASVAVAVPAVPTSVAEPIGDPLAENVTAPVGVTPFAPVTVAIRYVTSVGVSECTLVSSVRLLLELPAPPVDPPFHPATSLYASTDPSPVA